MRCPDCSSRNSVAARACVSCGHKFKRRPVPRGLIIGGAIAVASIVVWAAGAAIIPNLTDPEQNLIRVAKQVANGPKNPDENKRMSEEFDKAVRSYLMKQAGLPTPEIVKRMQKILPIAAFEVHAVDLPRGMRIVEVDTVLQASDYLLMKGSSGNKVFTLPELEVFDDARLMNESAGPMLVAIGHSGGQPPHHPKVRVYALLPDAISDETDKMLPKIGGEGSARFAKNGRDIILDLSLLSIGQIERLFAQGPQSEDGTAHQDLEWKDAHYTSRYEYGNSPFAALYAVARCMRYPDLTSGHRQYLGTRGEQLVRENKSPEARDFRVKRIPSSGDQLSYLMSGNIGTFAIDLAKINGTWSIASTRNMPASAMTTTPSAPSRNTAAAVASATTTKIPQSEPAQVKAPIVEKTIDSVTSGAAESSRDKKRQKAEQERLANQQKLEEQKREQKRLAQQKIEEQQKADAKRREAEKLARQKEKADRKIATKGPKTTLPEPSPEPAKPEPSPEPVRPEAASAAGEGQVTAPGSVNLRSGPSTSAKPITSVSKGAPLRIIGKQDGWYKVRYQGQDGFIYAGLVDYKKADAYTTATITKNPVVTDHNSKPLGKSRAGDRVVILGGLENNKYKVQMSNGKTGYVDKDAVNVTVDEPQFVP